jgi:hypothetical protein
VYNKHYMTWETLLAFQGRAILRRSGVGDPTVLADKAQVAKMVAERFPKESSLPPPPVREQEIIDAFKRGDEVRFPLYPLELNMLTLPK